MTDHESHEHYRDDLLRRAKAVVLELEELDEAITDYGTMNPEFWTPFDVKRTTIDIRTSRALLDGVVDKLMQVGRWDEIKKLGSWAAVKQAIAAARKKKIKR